MFFFILASYDSCSNVFHTSHKPLFYASFSSNIIRPSFAFLVSLLAHDFAFLLQEAASSSSIVLEHFSTMMIPFPIFILLCTRTIENLSQHIFFSLGLRRCQHFLRVQFTANSQIGMAAECLLMCSSGGKFNGRSCAGFLRS